MALGGVYGLLGGLGGLGYLPILLVALGGGLYGLLGDLIGLCGRLGRGHLGCIRGSGGRLPGYRIIQPSDRFLHIRTGQGVPILSLLSLFVSSPLPHEPAIPSPSLDTVQDTIDLFIDMFLRQILVFSGITEFPVYLPSQFFPRCAAIVRINHDLPEILQDHGLQLGGTGCGIGAHSLDDLDGLCIQYLVVDIPGVCTVLDAPTDLVYRLCP